MIIVADFAVPGKAFTEEIKEVAKEMQRNYKSTGGYYTYHIVTPQNYFVVSKSLATTVNIGQPIQYRLSYLFNEINGYRLQDSEPYIRHSMRWFVGLILPLLASGFLLYSLKKPEKYGVFVFALQAILIADIVYLLN